MSAAKTPQNMAQPTPQVLAGRTLKMMREFHGVSLRSMAEQAEVSASHLSRVESGERPASADLTDRLCAILANLPAPEKSA